MSGNLLRATSNDTVTASSVMIMIVMIVVLTTTITYAANSGTAISGPSTSSSINSTLSSACVSTEITSVTPVTAANDQTIIIRGCGFGSDPETIGTPAGDGSLDTVESENSPSMAIFDNYTGSDWAWESGFAINPSTPDTIGVQLVSWNETTIVLGGFGSVLGVSNPDKFSIYPGDAITFIVVGPDCTAATYPFPPFPASCSGEYQAIVQSSNAENGPAAPGQSCVAYSGYAYCVDGTESYYAPLLPSGIGTWEATTSDPSGATQSCVESLGYIFCVGGTTIDGNPTNDSFYAPLSSSGIGQWAATTSYPVATYGPSCAASSSYIYCLGGNSTVAGTDASNSTYFAALSSSGLGTWSQSVDYPISVLYGAGPFVDDGSGPSCVVSSGDIYCTNGSFCYPTIGGPGCIFTVNSYFAQVSAQGIGSPMPTAAVGWGSTQSYPPIAPSQDEVNPSCAAASGYIYCVGGGDGSQAYNATYFAPLTTAGIGNWTSATMYPAGVSQASCLISSGYIYCINGTSSITGTTAGTTYFAQVSNTGIGAWTPTTDFP